MITQYFVNPRTRLVRMLSGQPANSSHVEAIAEAKRSGCREVSAEEFEQFRRQTRVALDSGWSPSSRTSFDKFVEMRGLEI